MFLEISQNPLENTCARVSFLIGGTAVAWMCSVKKSVFRNFAKFIGKHLRQSLFFNKVAGLSPGGCFWSTKTNITEMVIAKPSIIKTAFFSVTINEMPSLKYHISKNIPYVVLDSLEIKSFPSFESPAYCYNRSVHLWHVDAIRLQHLHVLEAFL